VEGFGYRKKVEYAMIIFTSQTIPVVQRNGILWPLTKKWSVL